MIKLTKKIDLVFDQHTLLAFFIYLALGAFVYRWSKLKYEELVGDTSKAEEKNASFCQTFGGRTPT